MKQRKELQTANVAASRELDVLHPRAAKPHDERQHFVESIMLIDLVGVPNIH
jgi:hypothetical protein